MSYCVNCGVKLKKSEKKCPLCNTEVINSNYKNEYIPVYPKKVEEFKQINYKYVIRLIDVILLCLAFITLFCDFVTSGYISWSIYVVCSILYLGCHLTVFFHKKIFVSLLIELISTELFMFVIAYLNNGINWYLYLVLPFIIVLWMYIFLCVYFMKSKKKNILRRIAICFLFSSITLMVIEGAIDLYKYKIVHFNWSIYAVLPIIIMSILTFLMSYNKKIMSEIKRKMFI